MHYGSITGVTVNNLSCFYSSIYVTPVMHCVTKTLRVLQGILSNKSFLLVGSSDSIYGKCSGSYGEHPDINF